LTLCALQHSPELLLLLLELLKLHNMMQIVPDNATCSAGAVVRQQEVKLQQQLVDLQSRFVEEQRKAIWVIFSHHLHSL